MKPPRSKRLLLLQAACLLGTTVLFPAPASADVPACHRFIKNVNPVGKSTTWPNGSNWTVEAFGPGALNMNRSQSVSNSFNGTASISHKAVSAGIGFDVTWTGTVGTAYIIQVPAGQHMAIDAGYVSNEYRFEIWERCTHLPNSKKVGTGNASKYSHIVYKTRRL